MPSAMSASSSARARSSETPATAGDATGRSALVVGGTRTEKVRLHAREVDLHRLDRARELPRAQRIDQPGVILLVGRPSLTRVVPALEVAPDMALAGALDHAVHAEQKLVAARADDRVVEGKVPHLELLGRLGGGAALQAPVHLIE